MNLIVTSREVSAKAALDLAKLSVAKRAMLMPVIECVFHDPEVPGATKDIELDCERSYLDLAADGVEAVVVWYVDDMGHLVIERVIDTSRIGQVENPEPTVH